MEKQSSIDREAPRKLFPTCNSQPRVCASASRDEKSGDVIFKVVNATPQAVQASLQFKGARMPGRKSIVTFLTGNLADENSFEHPEKVAPVTTPFLVPASELAYSFQQHSLTVLRLPGSRQRFEPAASHHERTPLTP